MTTNAVEEEKLMPSSSQRPTYSHRLESLAEGDSSVERQAFKIEQRRKNRIAVTFFVRVKLLQECQKIAEERGYDSSKKISRQDLMSLRDTYAEKVAEQLQNPWLPWVPSAFGVQTFELNMLELLEKAVIHTMDMNDWFYYVEYSFYHTVVVSKFPWMRNESANAVFVVALFFLCTPIFFCVILGDENICNASSGINWLNGFYMASVTLSTVGYGDISVDNANITAGTFYMICSICVSILAFSAAAGDAFSPFAKYFIFDKNVGEGQVLSVRLALIKAVKTGEIVVHFVMLNLFGVIVSRFFHENLSLVEEGHQWTWSESIYWSVQSTTTIGYGDVIMSDGMRLFQVFYLCLGTFFVGNTLGKLASLKSDMVEIKRLHAWNEREVSKEMIYFDQADHQDPVVDQYEFVVASLLNLGKISASDVKPIMNKFRRLARSKGDKGYIDLDVPASVGNKSHTPQYSSL